MKTPDQQQQLVTLAVLAACFGTTARSIQREVKEGVLPKPVRRGLYDLVACVRRRLELVEQEGETDESTAEAKRRFWNARAEREELSVDRERNELVPFEEVRDFT